MTGGRSGAVAGRPSGAARGTNPEYPHPSGHRVVGSYVHSYDHPRPQYPGHIPGMRHAQDLIDGSSATPIYDALYSEYLRSFRALPFDRSGEESLGFTAFGTGRHRGYGDRAYPGSWQRDPNQPRHTPAALPPAPRRSG
jgi:hypothetical protein